MQYKALPWLRVCTFGLGAQSANIWIRDWNVRNAIIEVLILRNPRTLSDLVSFLVSSPAHFRPPCGQNGKIAKWRPEVGWGRDYLVPSPPKGGLAHLLNILINWKLSVCRVTCMHPLQEACFAILCRSHAVYHLRPGNYPSPLYNGSLDQWPRPTARRTSADRRQCLGEVSVQGLLSFGRAGRAED